MAAWWTLFSHIVSVRPSVRHKTLQRTQCMKIMTYLLAGAWWITLKSPDLLLFSNNILFLIFSTAHSPVLTPSLATVASFPAYRPGFRSQRLSSQQQHPHHHYHHHLLLQYLLPPPPPPLSVLLWLLVLDWCLLRWSREAHKDCFDAN